MAGVISSTQFERIATGITELAGSEPVMSFGADAVRQYQMDGAYYWAADTPLLPSGIPVHADMPAGSIGQQAFDTFTQSRTLALDTVAEVHGEHMRLWERVRLSFVKPSSSTDIEAALADRGSGIHPILAHTYYGHRNDVLRMYDDRTLFDTIGRLSVQFEAFIEPQIVHTQLAVAERTPEVQLIQIFQKGGENIDGVGAQRMIRTIQNLLSRGVPIN